VIDHLSVGVSDLARSIAFYDAVLGALGYVRLFAKESGAGWGRAGDRDEAFAVVREPEARAAGPGAHVAFTARTREAVDAFHAAALATGARDEGAPGLRREYGDGYYAAFVRDLDGHKLEAVCHE